MPADFPEYRLTIFVAGTSQRARRAIENLRRICEAELPGRYALAVIDVQTEPERAEDERILATPTVIKASPLPARRIIGDLSDTERVLMGLDLRPAAQPSVPEGTP